MTNSPRKKLIEVAIPLDAINAASVREKSIRHGHPSTLHLWWARRPLAACRAVLFAQLVDDPSGYVDTLLEDPKIRAQAEKDISVRLKAWQDRKASGQGNLQEAPEPTLSDCAAEIERRRLFAIIENLVKWENSTNEEVLECVRAEIRRSCDGELPAVYDPFSGGGSIPLEAQRLGLPAHGSDLNPVAVMIGKAMIEIPPKFRNMEPVRPGMKERQFYRNAEGLAEDVKHYGQWMRERAFERIGHLYPKVDLPKEHGGGQATVIAWIWARTVPSPDPAFSDVPVPLVSSFLLSSKAGKEVWVEPLVDRPARTVTWRIRKGGTTDEIATAREGTKAGRGANFRCIMSGTAITPDYTKGSGASGKMGEMLIAIVAEGKSGRIYVEPNEQHIAAAFSGKATTIANKCRETFLAGETPARLTGGTCHGYGLDQWGKLFTDRQLAALTTFSDLVPDARARVEADALAAGMSADTTPLHDGGKGAKAYAEAVSVYLGFGISRTSDAGSTIATWASDGFIRFTFARQALPMTWDFAECNVFSDSTGNFIGAVNWISKALAEFCPRSDGVISHQDAQRAILPQSAIISTDPPYYDNIGYADLSDFFFCWMRTAIKPVYPDLFGVLATPKSEELIAAPYRHGGKTAAEDFFLQGMSKAIANMARQSSGNYPATIYYAFKQSEIAWDGISSPGWVTFLQAVINAGFAVVGTWPMRTERPARTVAINTNALANSVVLVCRKREPSAETISRTEFIRTLKRELPPAVAELQAANIAPTDMPQSAIGPGMGVFSRYKAVLEADDTPMTVRSALQFINRELDEFLNDIQGEFDADTRFAITWFEQNGMAAGDYGAANSIATARGISVDSIRHAGIVESAGGKVRILKREELPDDWDPANDDHLTVWECCQHVIRALETQGERPAAMLLRKTGGKADAVKDLAYCLYDICSSKRQDAKEAISYNALIAVWAELTRQAASIQDIDLDGERQAAMNFQGT